MLFKTVVCSQITQFACHIPELHRCFNMRQKCVLDACGSGYCQRFLLTSSWRAQMLRDLFYLFWRVLQKDLWTAHVWVHDMTVKRSCSTVWVTAEGRCSVAFLEGGALWQQGNSAIIQSCIFWNPLLFIKTFFLWICFCFFQDKIHNNALCLNGPL